MLSYKDGTRVRLVSRHAKDLTGRFPELAAAIASLAPETLVLDGEVAVYDEQLVSRFEWMRRAPRDAVASPPMFMVFDPAQSRRPGRAARAAPHPTGACCAGTRRRARRAAPDPPLGGPWAQGVAAGTGARVGLVAKDPESPYVGGRSLKWFKVTQPRYREVERGLYKPS